MDKRGEKRLVLLHLPWSNYTKSSEQAKRDVVIPQYRRCIDYPWNWISMLTFVAYSGYLASDGLLRSGLSFDSSVTCGGERLRRGWMRSELRAEDPRPR